MTNRDIDKLFRGTPKMGDLTDAILKIEDPLTAIYFYNQYVAHIEALGNTQDPGHVAQANIGWCFGEGMSEERCVMWHVATGASHPSFGVLSPTPEQAFKLGQMIGEEHNKRQKRR